MACYETTPWAERQRLRRMASADGSDPAELQGGRLTLSGPAPRLPDVPKRMTRTLGEVAAMNLIQSEGLKPWKATRAAADAVSTVACLAIAALSGAGEGNWPTQAEYAAYWKIAERTAQRQWADFRRAFPEEQTPDRLARLVRDDYGRRLQESGVSAVLSMPAEGLFPAESQVVASV